MRILKKVAACLLVVVMTVSAAGCGSEKKETGKGITGTIKIATKPMTEQYILGEMLKQLIENKTDYKVEVTKGIGGGTSNIHPAMEKGEFDLYPEYTSSGWVMVLGNQAGEVSDDEILEKLQKEYQEKFQMTWLGLYGFNNLRKFQKIWCLEEIRTILKEKMVFRVCAKHMDWNLKM